MLASNLDSSMDLMLNDKTVEELKALLKTLAINDGFGCFTRTGFQNIVWPYIREDAEWIIFLDVNDMHALNSQYDSYDPVNQMIYEVLSLRDKRSDRKTDPYGLVGRLVEAFNKQNMSATFAVVPVISMDLMTNLAPAIKQVKQVKENRGVR